MTTKIQSLVSKNSIFIVKEDEIYGKPKQYPMTQEGYEKLEQELEELKTVKRPEVVEKIKVARSFGDLSENSEYDAAKDEQGFIEQDIQRIEHMIRNALIIEDNGDNNVVQIGKTVTFIELPGDEEESYQIVGSAEADAFKGKISNESNGKSTNR